MPVTIETYLCAGDHVRLGQRSTLNEPVTGTLLQINGGPPGDREFVILKDGHDLGIDGAIGVPERDVVVAVERGDCWLNLGPLLTLEQAKVKCARNSLTQTRKNAKDFPLFPDQATIRELSPHEMVAQFRAGAQRELERDHERVSAVNVLREEVRSMIPADQFSMCLERRQIYPGSSEYGTIFWKRQREYILANGHAEPKPVFPPSIASRINDRFKLDGPAIWTAAPGKPLRMRVLFFGRETILCKVEGQPIKDYDPIPHPTVWLKPEELEQPGRI